MKPLLLRAPTPCGWRISRSASRSSPLYRVAHVRVVVAWLGVASYSERALDVTLSFRGDDPLFTYVRGYALSLQTRHATCANAVDLVVFDRGGATTPFGEGLVATWR